MLPLLRSWSPGHFRIGILSVLIIALLIFIANQLGYQPQKPSELALGKLNPALVFDRGIVHAHGQFWKNFQPLLEQYAPTCDSPERKSNAQGVFFKPNEEVPRKDLLIMKPEDVMEMKDKHTAFVKSINDSSLTPVYRSNTRGIVTTAGGKYLPVFTVSLRMLRRTGCNMPVEVFLANRGEYEPHICDTVFKSLNAKCVVLDDILTFADNTREIKSYQFKILAMLFSSYEDILFLDADAFPLRDPAQIFDSDLYKKNQLITWPDFWGSSASPLYYRIASINEPKMSERASTESGEIFISKKSHRSTLLLSMYYNYHGPDYYYKLFSQGGPGEGDKETFIAAATVMHEPFYQVSERIGAIGRRQDGGGMAGSAMVQYDPVEDYALISQGKWRVKDDSVAPRPRPLFIHANVPKFNPATIFDTDHHIDPVRDDHGKWTRPWTVPEDTVQAIGGFELEKQFWIEIKGVGCELEDKFESWKGKHDICKTLTEYYKAVFEKDDTSKRLET
ncbi:hypothetical protein KEM56_005871 [Ascosphaera pollenicola]|nr:hypothetical protein KEM56_005871 [Ascosphaera pollenicola]